MIKAAQHIIAANDRLQIEGDWYYGYLPENIQLGEMSYPETAYSYIGFHSRKKNGFRLGYASGNYGRSDFIAGREGEINVGNYVVLQGTTLISNRSITIKDHCMLSWDSVVTDSWLDESTYSIEARRSMLIATAANPDRSIEFANPRPVTLEENAWVGFGAIILPGVTLGRGCVVGSNAIVTKDVEAYGVAVGNPARVIRKLEPTDTHLEKSAMAQMERRTT